MKKYSKLFDILKDYQKDKIKYVAMYLVKHTSSRMKEKIILEKNKTPILKEGYSLVWNSKLNTSVLMILVVL